MNNFTAPINISLGVAGLADKVSKEITLDKLLDRADNALYESKQAGRNQVSVWQNTKEG